MARCTWVTIPAPACINRAAALCGPGLLCGSRLCAAVLLAPVQYALGFVVKESFTLYKAVSEGIINLADSFFEMDYLDAGGVLRVDTGGLAATPPWLDGSAWY